MRLKVVLHAQPHPQFLKWYKKFSRLLTKSGVIRDLPITIMYEPYPVKGFENSKVLNFNSKNSTCVTLKGSGKFYYTKSRPVSIIQNILHICHRIKIMMKS